VPPLDADPAQQTEAAEAVEAAHAAAASPGEDDAPAAA
jgi:hypothetical protein